MDIVLIKLLLAHLVGDFFLQSNKWVAEKEKKKLASSKLYLHVAIHVVLVFLVMADFGAGGLALSIGVLHYIIDAFKLLFQREKTKRFWFFLDQILHVVSVVFCWYVFYKPYISFAFLYDDKVWLMLLGALFLTMPTAIIIRVVIAKFIPEKTTASLQNAGKLIGVLERLLIFIFILTHHFEAVGFLLGAKSIFRFGDLTKANDIKLTEYVLIGTLLSFGMAIGVGLLLQ